MTDEDKSDLVRWTRLRKEALARVPLRGLMRRILSLTHVFGLPQTVERTEIAIGVRTDAVGPNGERPDDMIENVKRSDLYALWFKHDPGAVLNESTGMIVNGYGYFTWRTALKLGSFAYAEVPKIVDRLMDQEAADDDRMISMYSDHALRIVDRVRFEYDESRRAADKAEMDRVTSQMARRTSRSNWISLGISVVVSTVVGLVSARIQADATLKAAAPPYASPATTSIAPSTLTHAPDPAQSSAPPIAALSATMPVSPASASAPVAAPSVSATTARRPDGGK